MLHAILAETAVLPAMKSVSRRRPACLPIVHIYCAVVVAIVVESTKGFEYYCCRPPDNHAWHGIESPPNCYYMSKGLAHSPLRPLSGGCAGPLLTNVDVEARATSAHERSARWAMALIIEREVRS